MKAFSKPFSVTVLCKKIAAVFSNLERRGPWHDLFDDSVLKIDFSEQSASLTGKPLEFTPLEHHRELFNKFKLIPYDDWLFNLSSKMAVVFVGICIHSFFSNARFLWFVS